MLRLAYFSAVAGLLIAIAVTAADLPPRTVSGAYDPAWGAWALIR